MHSRANYRKRNIDDWLPLLESCALAELVYVLSVQERMGLCLNARVRLEQVLSTIGSFSQSEEEQPAGARPTKPSARAFPPSAQSHLKYAESVCERYHVALSLTSKSSGVFKTNRYIHFCFLLLRVNCRL